MAGTHSFGSLCMFIFTDKPAIFAASTSACVCSKTLFQSMPSLEQASSELGNAFNSLVANLNRPWCRRLPFPAQRCIVFSYTFEKQASKPALLWDSSSADYIPTQTLSREFTLREFHLPTQPLVLCCSKVLFEIKACSNLNRGLNIWKFIKRTCWNYSVWLIGDCQ